MPIDRSDDSEFELTRQSATAGDLSAQPLGPRSDLTYRKLEKLTVEGADLHHSLFTGSLLRQCVWTKVDFQRSDLDGVRAEQCRFIECDFRICDVRSCHFVGCTFEACLFDDTFVDDCDFHDSELRGCSFKGASQTECRFHNSVIAACQINPGTFLHNHLYRCSISDMLLGDCTILCSIFRDCNLERVTINAESIGGILGLTREQVRAANLVYLGREQPIPAGSDVIMLISDEYKRRRWHIGELVLALNFDLMSRIGAFDSYLSRAFPRFKDMGFAKGDEVQFVGDILEELASLEKLPLMVTMNVLQWCLALGSAMGESQEGRVSGQNEGLRTLASRTNLLVNTLLDRLEDVACPLQFPENETPVTLRATFRQKPAIQLHVILNAIGDASELPIQHKSSFVRVEAGSYIEVVSTTLFSTVAFQVFLFLLNGCVIQLTELKHRLKVLARKEGPKTYRDLALGPTQPASPVVLSLLQALARYAKDLAWLREPLLSGFQAQNVEKLEILDRK